jgi:hypothetical protein
MIDLKMLKYSPSHLVATAVHTALRIQKDTEGWTACLAHHTGFVEAELLTCAEDVRGLIEQAPQEARCKAVYKKFSHVKFDEVPSPSLRVPRHPHPSRCPLLRVAPPLAPCTRGCKLTLRPWCRWR